MASSLKGPRDSSTPALGHKNPVNLSTNQSGDLRSSLEYPKTIAGDADSEWSVDSPGIVRPVKYLAAPHPQENSRGKNRLLPPIQLPDNNQPLVDFSENKATFDFIASAKSKNNDHDFTPLPPAIPLPCKGSESDDKINLALARHMEACLPGVHEASRALQRIVEAEYEGEFREPLRPILPMFIPLWRQTQAAKGTLGNAVVSNPRMQHRPNPSVNVSEPGSHFWPGVGAWRELVKEVKFLKDLKRARNAEGHWEASADIDGRGRLRKSVFWHGSQSYSRQRETELLSLSFFDSRPDPQTGAIHCELILHFEADLMQDENEGTKLMLYELYAPPIEFPWQRQENPPGRQTSSRKKQWIAFSITSPIVTFSPSAISAVVNSPGPHTRIGPPNLPDPAPQSWLMFATHFENVTAHPVTKDVPVSSTPASQPTFPRCPPLTSAQQQNVLRRDFDFSRNFAPIFEFSPNVSENDQLVSNLCIEDLRGEFLSVRGMRAYNATTDTIISPTVESPAPLKDKNHKSEKDGDKPKHLIDKQRTGGDVTAGNEKHEAEPDTELSGNKWWHEARQGFVADAEAWRRVRDAMARGCCRIVARTAPERQQPELIPGQETRDPGLKRAYPIGSQTDKRSALCRGLERGSGPGEERIVSKGNGMGPKGTKMGPQ